MRRWISAFKWLLGLLLLAGVGLGTWVLMGGPDVAADRDHARLTHWFLQTTRERAVSRRADELRLPPLEPLAGTELLTAVAGYEGMCAACHAPPGGTPTALARGLNPPAPDLAQIARKRSAAELFWVTRHGIRMTGMPAWGPTHSDAELLPLVALIKQFPEFADGEYAELLAEAKAAGIEHDHDHDHDHGRDHNHGHDYDHGQDHDSGADADPEPSDVREHDHDH